MPFAGFYFKILCQFWREVGRPNEGEKKQNSTYSINILYSLLRVPSSLRPIYAFHFTSNIWSDAPTSVPPLTLISFTFGPHFATGKAVTGAIWFFAIKISILNTNCGIAFKLVCPACVCLIGLGAECGEEYGTTRMIPQFNPNRVIPPFRLSGQKRGLL